ncbi:hypothetical protein [Rhodoferax sp. UBA5149]|uniref:hypothetical protein n=1 Tax=Rhodoferax sp. UBA5149 TaxID=1947379 RepID=UPI0025CCA35E|nr:hypothetical protein [Rhodoferax sp. UBA5149]
MNPEIMVSKVRKARLRVAAVFKLSPDQDRAASYHGVSQRAIQDPLTPDLNIAKRTNISGAKKTSVGSTFKAIGAQVKLQTT